MTNPKNPPPAQTEAAPPPSDHLTGQSGCEVDPQGNGSLRHSEHNADSKHDSQRSAVTHAAGISSPAAPANHVAPDNRHEFVPNKKYPWFCAHCGYAPHEPLKHVQPANSSEGSADE